MYTDLPTPNTSVSTPNSQCPYFLFFDWTFCRCTTNQSKQNSVKDKFFYHSSCKNSVWTHIFNYTDALHLDDFICLHLRKLFLIEDRRTLSPETMHHVCCFRWCRHILSWTVVVWSEFVSLVSWILPPLCRFCATTYHRHVGRWLTSVKFWCKVDVHWFNKLFFTNQNQLYTMARNMHM